MWINEKINQSNSINQIFTGTVVKINANTIDVSSSSYISNIPIMSYFGIYSFPNVGDTVVILSLDSNNYVCIGRIEENISYSSPYIILNENGDINLNSAIINSAGQLIQK